MTFCHSKSHHFASISASLRVHTYTIPFHSVHRMNWETASSLSSWSFIKTVHNRKFGRLKSPRIISMSPPICWAMSDATSFVAVAVVAKTGTHEGNKRVRSRIRRKAGRKSCPHEEIQCASSITTKLIFILRTSFCQISFSCLSGAIYKILRRPCFANSIVSRFCSNVCSLFMSQAGMPLAANAET